MATLVILQEKAGERRVRRCDSRCYGAGTRRKCRCLCGGTNHGAGHLEAVKTTVERAGAWAERLQCVIVFRVGLHDQPGLSFGGDVVTSGAGARRAARRREPAAKKEAAHVPAPVLPFDQ